MELALYAGRNLLTSGHINRRKIEEVEVRKGDLVRFQNPDAGAAGWLTGTVERIYPCSLWVRVDGQLIKFKANGATMLTTPEIEQMRADRKSMSRKDFNAKWAAMSGTDERLSRAYFSMTV